MLDAVRRRLARRAILAAARERTPRPLPGRPDDRHALVLLPVDETGQRAAWPLIAELDLPASQLSLVVVSERVAYAPDRFVGSVRRIGPKDTDWRGLPRAETVVALHGSVDVAINLSAGDDLAAAFLVGASPAAIRIGAHAREAERYYDLMLAGAASQSELVAALRHALQQIDPPILPLA